MTSSSSSPAPTLSTLWSEYTVKLPENAPTGLAFMLAEVWEGCPDVAAVTILYGEALEPETEEPEAIKALSTNNALQPLLQTMLERSGFWPDDTAPPTLVYSTLAPDDWTEAWKQFWGVDAITPRLTICPSWERYTPSRPEEIVLHLDPGMAFGTGQHQTTRLMLQAIEALAKPLNPEQKASLRLLDCGTGSGILAIAAAKLGFTHIEAIDITDASIEATTQNAERNGVAEFITASLNPLEHWPEAPTWEVLLVNILAPVIQALLPALTARAQPGAVLLASGVVEHQQAGLVEQFEQAGWHFSAVTQQNHWVCLRFTKA